MRPLGIPRGEHGTVILLSSTSPFPKEALNTQIVRSISDPETIKQVVVGPMLGDERHDAAVGRGRRRSHN